MISSDCFGSVGFINHARLLRVQQTVLPRLLVSWFNNRTAPDPGEEQGSPCERNGFCNLTNCTCGFDTAQWEVTKGQLWFGKRNLARNLEPKPYTIVIQEKSARMILGSSRCIGGGCQYIWGGSGTPRWFPVWALGVYRTLFLVFPPLRLPAELSVPLTSLSAAHFNGSRVFSVLRSVLSLCPEEPSPGVRGCRLLDFRVLHLF